LRGKSLERALRPTFFLGLDDGKVMSSSLDDEDSEVSNLLSSSLNKLGKINCFVSSTSDVEFGLT